MSAVFLLAIAALPHREEPAFTCDVPLSAERVVRQVAAERLAAVSEEVLAEALSYEEDDVEVRRRGAGVRVSAFLDRVFAGADDDAPRFWESECEYLVLRGVPYVATAEVTHGDFPEGVFEEIELVSHLRLFEEPILW